MHRPRPPPRARRRRRPSPCSTKAALPTWSDPRRNSRRTRRCAHGSPTCTTTRAGFPQAIQWYEASLAIDPKNVDVSTDLAAAYYYMNDFDRALTQIDHSLAINRTHAKTLLNQGIILAFGKHDLAGAKASWEKVVATAPGTEEAARARQGLDAIATAGGSAWGVRQRGLDRKGLTRARAPLGHPRAGGAAAHPSWS
jgi:tetratricopeptide (TPR) repeat protein